MSLYNFSTVQSSQDPTQQAGYNQYIQQGQNSISPGQYVTQASNPVSAATMANFAKALQQPQQQLPAQLPDQQAQAGLMGGAAMGQAGPTPQALALAQGLQPQPMQTNLQQFMNPPSDD